VVFLYGCCAVNDHEAVRAVGEKLLPLADKIERAAWPSATTKAA
jgi:hypothetical protein